jgi:hypothetical protein
MSSDTVPDYCKNTGRFHCLWEGDAILVKMLIQGKAAIDEPSVGMMQIPCTSFVPYLFIYLFIYYFVVVLLRQSVR